MKTYLWFKRVKRNCDRKCAKEHLNENYLCEGHFCTTEKIVVQKYLLISTIFFHNLNTSKKTFFETSNINFKQIIFKFPRTNLHVLFGCDNIPVIHFNFTHSCRSVCWLVCVVICFSFSNFSSIITDEVTHKICWIQYLTKTINKITSFFNLFFFFAV